MIRFASGRTVYHEHVRLTAPQRPMVLVTLQLKTIAVANAPRIIWEIPPTDRADIQQEQPVEATSPINYTAIALLRSWRNEDPEQQRQGWEALKQVIEEDRSSDRKLFP